MAEGEGEVKRPRLSDSAQSNKVALITGITGQDGSYLAELLLEKGYVVHGIIRRSSTFNTGRIIHLYADRATHTTGRMMLHYGDLTDASSLVRLVTEIRPNEIYNLGAQSHVKLSFDLSEYTANVDGVGTLRLLDAIRTAGLEKTVKFYQASTSELYGKVQEIPQKETTPFYPRSPYGAAKLYAYWIIVNYREAYGMFTCNGLLFNHESPRRGETFVTRKVTRGVAKIHLGLMDNIRLGNLDSKRDWGHARDYVERIYLVGGVSGIIIALDGLVYVLLYSEGAPLAVTKWTNVELITSDKSDITNYAMWLMLQQDTPDDYVVATGEVHSVRELVEVAFAEVNIKIRWEGAGVDEVGIEEGTGKIRIQVDPKYYRPTEVDFLQGDATKIYRALGWKPKTTFKQLVKEMVESDIQLMKKNPSA